MKYVNLAGSDLNVSNLCMGTLNFGCPLTQEDVNRHLDYFVAHGGNFVDTAHVYSDWLPGTRSRSEKMLGQWLTERPRDSIVLATKGGHFDLNNEAVSRVTKEEVTKDIDESLSYLNTDYIDLYFLHRDNEDVPVGEILEYMNEFIAQGKTRAIGCSNWRLPRVIEAQNYAKAHGLQPFVTNQLMWSLANINPGSVPADYALMDEETFAYHNSENFSVMCFSSQAKGYFARRQQGEDLPASVLDSYQSPENDAIYAKLLLEEKATGKTLSQQGLQYFLNQPFPAIPLISCDNQAQLEECMSAFED